MAIHSKVFERLWLQNRSKVYVHGYKFFRGDRELAQEVEQRTALQVWRSMNSGTGWSGESKFTTWLWMVCRNECLMIHRQRAKERGRLSFIGTSQDVAALHTTNTSPDRIVDAHRLLERASRRARRMNRVSRLYFFEYCAKGRTMKELAAMEHTNEPCFKSRVGRAKWRVDRMYDELLYNMRAA